MLKTPYMKKLLIALLFSGCAVTLFAQPKAYIKLDEGNVNDEGLKNNKPGYIEVFKFSFEHNATDVVNNQQHSTSEVADGRRKMGVLTVVKSMNNSGELLNNAFVSKKPISSLVLEVFKAGADINGKPMMVFTLRKVLITKINLNYKGSNSENNGRREEITFDYEAITYKHE